MSNHINVSLFVPHAGCPHQCSFCNQRAISGQQELLTPAQVTAVCSAAAEQVRGVDEAEIAFFGGSFTAIPADYRRQLLKAAYPFVQQGLFQGIRISTRPDYIDTVILDELRSFGVTAVELGAQSMDDRVLTLNRRGHTAAQVVQASRLIRQAGLSLGLQMMTGLPGSDNDTDWQTAEKLADLQPDTMRIYPTLVMPDTYLHTLYREGLYTPPTLEQAVELCARLLAFFEERGIPVIRLGLHADQSLQQQLAAGPWHPAFRELCQGRLYLNKAEQLLKTALPQGGTAVLQVAPTELSKMIGQRKCNLLALKQKGWQVSVEPGHLPAGEIRIEVRKDLTL